MFDVIVAPNSSSVCHGVKNPMLPDLFRPQESHQIMCTGVRAVPTSTPEQSQA